MKTHELKTWPSFFAGLRDGTKTFELRKNDRAFDVGDLLVLREWKPVGECYTGELELRRVSCMLTSTQFGGLQPGFVIMGIQRVGEGKRQGFTAGDGSTLEEMVEWIMQSGVGRIERYDAYYGHQHYYRPVANLAHLAELYMKAKRQETLTKRPAGA